MHHLDNIEDIGWTLRINKDIKTCHNCGKKIGIPFLFCPEFEEGYCEKCKCNSTEVEHEHFIIRELKRDK